MAFSPIEAAYSLRMVPSFASAGNRNATPSRHRGRDRDRAFVHHYERDWLGVVS